MMPKQYTQEQLDQILAKLPEELNEALFSAQTADTIWNACEKRGIMDERMGKIAKYTGHVLMGLMLPSEFQEILEKEVQVPKKTAQELAREINRFVFYPVKPALEQLHRMEIEVSAKIVTPKPEEPGQAQEQEPSEEQKGEDRYRESI